MRQSTLSRAIRVIEFPGRRCKKDPVFRCTDPEKQSPIGGSAAIQETGGPETSAESIPVSIEDDAPGKLRACVRLSVYALV